MGPIRAAEYHLPVVRVASSGVSQAIDSTGKVIASAPCPGQGAVLSAALNFSKSTRLPPDRWLAAGSAALTGILLTALSVLKFLKRRTI
jgi:apolipoprotein N-acyltransferase